MLDILFILPRALRTVGDVNVVPSVSTVTGETPLPRAVALTFDVAGGQ